MRTPDWFPRKGESVRSQQNKIGGKETMNFFPVDILLTNGLGGLSTSLFAWHFLEREEGQLGLE